MRIAVKVDVLYACRRYAAVGFVSINRQFVIACGFCVTKLNNRRCRDRYRTEVSADILTFVYNALNRVILLSEINRDVSVFCTVEFYAFDILWITVLCAVVYLGKADELIGKLVFGNTACYCAIIRIKVVFIAEYLIVHGKFSGIAACKRRIRPNSRGIFGIVSGIFHRTDRSDDAAACVKRLRCVVIHLVYKTGYCSRCFIVNTFNKRCFIYLN